MYLRVAILFLLLNLCAWADLFGAIAYSPTTGKYGYSNQCDTRAEAERLALSCCLEPDARVAVWVKNGWAVIYRNSSGAWFSAWSSSSRAAAERIAQKKVPGGRLHCWVYSGK